MQCVSVEWPSHPQRCVFVCAHLLCPSACRSLSGAPLYVADSQLVLPQAEWQALLQAAKASRSFALQLAGELEDLQEERTAKDFNHHQSLHSSHTMHGLLSSDSSQASTARGSCVLWHLKCVLSS